MTGTTETSAAVSPRRRWRKVTIVGIAAVALAGIFHAPLLRGVAGLLVFDQALPRDPVSFVLIKGGDRQYDVAANLLRTGAAGGVLQVEAYPEPLVREGILPPREERVQEALMNRGARASKLTIIIGQARNEWQAARQLSAWLRERPGTSLVVLCNRFDSRRQHNILASALTDKQMQAVFVRALPDRRFDERNWWQMRAGLKWFFKCAVRTIYDYAYGEAASVEHDFGVEDYHRHFETLLPPASAE